MGVVVLAAWQVRAVEPQRNSKARSPADDGGCTRTALVIPELFFLSKWVVAVNGRVAVLFSGRGPAGRRDSSVL